MAKIELSILGRQCLRRRIPDLETCRHETGVWIRERDAQNAKMG